MNRGPRGQEARRRNQQRARDIEENATRRVAARRAEQARSPYASNWRTLLAVDASLGLVAFAVGLVLLFLVNVWIGAGVGALGASYVFLVARRYRYWQTLRAERGLDT